MKQFAREFWEHIKRFRTVMNMMLILLAWTGGYAAANHSMWVLIVAWIGIFIVGLFEPTPSSVPPKGEESENRTETSQEGKL